MRIYSLNGFETDYEAKDLHGVTEIVESSLG